MSLLEEIRVTEAQVEAARGWDIKAVAERLGLDGLKRERHELVGPCPSCGGTDRFAISLRKGAWLCRRCGGAGDAIGLVEFVQRLEFKAAVLWLVGGEAVELSPEERRRREEARARAEAEKAREAEAYRQRAIAGARSVWRQGRAAAGTQISEYLRRRGLPEALAAEPPAVLRFHPDLAYVVEESGRPETIHRGPAMLALIQGPGRGELIGVHRTWLDLSRPKGKADLGLDAKGRPRPAKKVWGTKRRGAIRLTHPRGGDFAAMVMGEGIETTCTALAADPVPGAAYWAGIDLGHMAGQRRIRGEGMRFAGIPDLDDEEGFLPPRGVRRLVFIQDGDSDPRDTRAKLLAGLRRARARVPGLERIEIVHAGEGRDLNDILMGAGTGVRGDDERHGAAA